MADGTVELARWDSKANGGSNKGTHGGKMVWISYSNGMSSRYMHMSDITVSAGQKVKQGQHVGKTGLTGSPGQPHLHMEVLSGGNRINPASMFNRQIGKTDGYDTFEW